MTCVVLIVGVGPTATARTVCEKPGGANRVRIVKIGDEKVDHWPGFAALRRKRGGVEQFFCGATAIGSEWLVTAAHCVEMWKKNPATGGFVDDKGWQLEIVLSPEDLDFIPEANIYDVDTIIIHDAYKTIEKSNGDLAGVLNDIALIKLTREWRGAIASIGTIPVANTLTSPLLRVAGFGLTKGNGQQELRTRKTDGSSYYAGSQKLKVATLPQVPLQRCRAAYEQSEFIDTRHICAGSIWKGEDSCNGDSGGPLMSPEATTGCPYLVGVVSWGPENCGSPEKYGIYTRLSEFADWFRDKANLTVRVADTSGIPLTARQEQLLQQLQSALQPVAASLDVGMPRNGRLKSGQLFRLTLDSSVSGKLIVIDIRPDGRIRQIVPNSFSTGHIQIASDAPLRLPNTTAHGFDAFEAEAAGGKGRIVAIAVPETFPYDAFVRGSTAIKGAGTSILEYADDSGTQYLMSVVDQVLRSIAATKAAGSPQRRSWAIGISDYEYVD